MTKTRIVEIEFNFSNKCGASCFICSDFHGCDNAQLMSPEVFYVALSQLKQIDFDVIQTSGNGDAFLNQYYFEYVRELREAFPKAEIHFYSNFALLNKERANIFVNENLIDKIFTRIDTLNPVIFKKSTGLSFATVMENIMYFHSINKRIDFSIGYSSILSYYKLCKRVLNREPINNRFSSKELASLHNEFGSLLDLFGGLSGGPIRVNKINQSLWAERVQVKADGKAVCPKLGILDKVTWICPNGDISVCGYDDKQGDFIAGNIMNEHIAGIWKSSKRKEILEKIKSREHKEYPCINPALCKMYGQEI